MNLDRYLNRLLGLAGAMTGFVAFKYLVGEMRHVLAAALVFALSAFVLLVVEIATVRPWRSRR